MIVFAAGVTGTITLTSGELFFSKSLTIAGPGASNLTVSGNNASRVFSVSGGEIVISGLRIANGFSSGNPNANLGGGGIFNNQARLTVQNCEIVNNTHSGGPGSGFAITGQGGGVWHVAAGNARLLLRNCLFSGNTALGGTGNDGGSPNGAGGDAAPGQGGGLFIFPSSVNSVTIQDCLFENNLAIGGTGGNGMGTGARGRGGRGQGGAVFVEQNTLLVAQGSTFKNNTATGGNHGAGSNAASSNTAEGQGGAIHVVGFAVITGCTLDDNEANGGSGIAGTSLIGAPGQGGGLFYAFGAVNVSNTTVINNTATGGDGGAAGGTTRFGQGGGIFVRSSSAPLNLTNSTVALNTAAGGADDNSNIAGNASGGGIWTEQAVNATNSTIAFNVAASDASNTGGGLFVSGGVTTLRNSLIAENVVDAAPNDATGPVAAASSNNLIEAGVGLTGITNGTNNNQIGTSGAPILPQMHGPALNGGPTKTCSIDANSPAVNAGNDANAPDTDQRAYVRAGVSDIGAFEFGGTPPSPPSAVPLTSVASRKFHGAPAFFDIPLPLTGNPGIECRSSGGNGDQTLIFTFVNPLTSVDGASVMSGTGTVTSGVIGINPREYLVNLTGVSNAQTITVSLTNVTDSLGNNSSTVAASMGVLLGDTNGDGVVNSGDALQTRSRSGQGTAAANFRSDVNADGFINSGDTIAVRSRSGTSLP